MKRRQKLQVGLVLVAAMMLAANFVWNWSFPDNELLVPEDEYRLSTLRESLAGSMERADLFQTGYATMLIGWALLYDLGKSSVGHLIDAVVDDQLPSLAVFFPEDRRDLYAKLPREVAKLEVTGNPENFNIWKLLQPKNCQNILPLYLNTKTGAFICGDASVANIELWRRGLPHLPFSPFTGPALALEPGKWTTKQWIKYIFQGVTR